MVEIRVLLILALMVVTFGMVFQLINKEQMDPYMDEVFHVPQVQKYCEHNFSHWDNMITTLPGLYISSLLWIEPLQQITESDFCDISYLRFQNVCLTILCYPIIYLLMKSIHPRTQPDLLSPLSLVLFPLVFFFAFLYYTDAGSTLLVLTGLLLATKRRHIMSSLILLCAVFFRQTNIIWAGFVAGTVGLRIVEPKMKNTNGGTLLSLLSAVVSSLPMLVSSLWSYMILGIGFCLFVVVNGSIVVGDKKHHTASFHLPQFLYFVSFSCLLSAGPILSSMNVLKKLLFNMISSPKYIVSFIVLTFVYLATVHYYTYEHPYLLADNRHYTFYVWKNVYRSNPHMKYYLTPVYSVCTIVLVHMLAQLQSKLWLLLFIGSCLMALVPQALLEFRYYIIPYLLYRIHSKPVPVWGSALECLQYCLINVITVWLFLRRPFKWEGHTGLQRFMW